MKERKIPVSEYLTSVENFNETLKPVSQLFGVRQAKAKIDRRDNTMATDGKH